VLVYSLSVMEVLRMVGKLWLVGGAVALLVLLLGVVMFFGLLIGLNGYSEAKGGAILLAYLVAMVAALVLTVWGSIIGVQVAAARTGWSFWLLGPLAVVGAVLAAFVLMALCAVALLMVMS
jgi:hypothetical protein